LPYITSIYFPYIGIIEIITEETTCDCSAEKHSLQRQWQTQRTNRIISLGNCKITLIICRCSHCKKAYFPEQYQNLVPKNGIYGYDVIDKIGNLRYFQLYQDKKIQDIILKENGFIIPLSTIRHLTKKYVDYLSAIHYSRSKLLKTYFEKKALVLHCDGTYEGDTEIHFSMRDSISGIVLYNQKIKTENKKDIAECIEKCVKLFGKPIAVVCDLSKNIRDAVKSVLSDTPLLICHFHFLENIGEALLGETRKELSGIIKRSKIISYLSEKRQSISKSIKKHQDDNNINPSTEEIEFNKFINGDVNAKISKKQQKRYLALTQLNWIADYKYKLNGEYFPFSIKEVAFVEKCIETVSNLKKIFPKNTKGKTFGPIFSAYERLKEFVRQNKLKVALERINLANDFFNKTRTFFKLNSTKNIPVSRVKLSDNNYIIENLKAKMQGFEDELKMMQENNISKEFSETILKYMEKYRNNLTGHVLIHTYNDNDIVINIPRTNNIMETLFGGFKRKIRKRIGCKRLTNHFKAMHKDEFLIENLTNQTYLDIMLNGSIDNLVKIFPQFDQKAFLTSVERKQNNGNFKLKKSIIRDEFFQVNIATAFKYLIQTD
jgi:hypothetical protein